ncbi:hypothetical protein KFK09_022084 [Dendrobium nobile]|uniref:Uncharacterized protein n=1 Tax=Dendrobium nobile TaxID=94219 RepID=A0A8T3AID5_DENNO|nr:hypothetical protein KFK09_022084 [Dendrobium nobile]
MIERLLPLCSLQYIKAGEEKFLCWQNKPLESGWVQRERDRAHRNDDTFLHVYRRHYVVYTFTISIYYSSLTVSHCFSSLYMALIFKTREKLKSITPRDATLPKNEKENCLLRLTVLWRSSLCHHDVASLKLAALRCSALP